MFKPETIEEYKIYEYLKNNFLLEYFKIYRFDGGLKIVDDKGDILYFWIDNCGSIEYGEYPF